MIPHDALHWIYQMADYQCVSSYPRDTLKASMREAATAIEALKQVRLITEFEDRSCVWIDFEKYPVITNPKTGKLCTYTEDDGVIEVEAEQLLHYIVEDKLLPLHLANMLERSISLPPVEHIPGLLWELGPVKTRHGNMPAWYVRRLMSNYEVIKGTLAGMAEGTSGLLFSGESVLQIYQSLPGIRKVLIVGESLDPWSERTQIDPRLLDNIFQSSFSEFSDLPFDMPADKSSIRDNTTGEVYELTNNQCEFFYYVLEQLKEGHSKVKLKKILSEAGYSTSYTSLNTPLNG